jgi:hypothetical protein
LRSQVEVRSGPAVNADDPFGQQILDRLAGAGLIRAEQMIERAVFTDDDDHVPYRCQGHLLSLDGLLGDGY